MHKTQVIYTLLGIYVDVLSKSILTMYYWVYIICVYIYMYIFIGNINHYDICIIIVIFYHVFYIHISYQTESYRTHVIYLITYGNIIISSYLRLSYMSISGDERQAKHFSKSSATLITIWLFNIAMENHHF